MNVSTTTDKVPQNLDQLASIFEKKEEQSGVFLSNIAYAIRKYKYMIIFLVIIFGFIGWYTTAKKPIVYRSFLTLINEPDIATGSGESSRFMLYLTQHYYQTQYEILVSRTLSEKVALQMIEEGLPLPKDSESYLDYSRIYRGYKQVKSYLLSILLSIDSDEPKQASIDKSKDIGLENVSKQQLSLINRYTHLVQSGLRISGGDKSQLMTLSFISSDPVFATKALNLIAKVFINYILESKQQVNQSTIKWLVLRLESAKNALLESEKKLLEFQRDNDLSDSDILENRNSSLAIGLKQQYNKAKLTYNELLATYGSKHPEVKKAATEIAVLNNSLNQVSGSNLKQKDLIFQLAKYENELKANSELYQTYFSQFNGFNLNDNQTRSNIQILDQAQKPSAPISPNLKRTIFIWGLLGVVLGILSALFLTLMDQTFKKISDVEQKLKITVLGQLPFVSKKEMEKYADNKNEITKLSPEKFYPVNSKTVFAEAINHIRTNILFSNVDKQPQTILITSSIQSEGKTTLSANLAFALSKIDKTLLIDADLRKPKIAKVFLTKVDNINQFGLVDHLAELCTFEECSFTYDSIENLTIIPAGTIPPNPQELLASKHFNQFLENVKLKYKYIVIDTAPVLPVSDALVLGKVVDTVLVSIKANSTSSNFCKETLKRLKIAHIRPAGVILSQLSKQGHEYYGKDGGYYHYTYTS